MRPFDRLGGYTPPIALLRDLVAIADAAEKLQRAVTNAGVAYRDLGGSVDAAFAAMTKAAYANVDGTTGDGTLFSPDAILRALFEEVPSDP